MMEEWRRGRGSSVCSGSTHQRIWLARGISDEMMVMMTMELGARGMGNEKVKKFVEKEK